MPLLLLVAFLVLAPAPALAATAVWVPPVPVEVGRAFDPPAQRWGSGHRGVDLAGAAGMPVRAAGAGVVGHAGLLAGRGVVTVVHGELRTTYEPVRALVVAGQRVAAGEVIGLLEPGHAGCVAAACLHWGLLRGDVYLDPLTLVGRGPPRLLPYLSGEPPAAVSPRRSVAPERPAGTRPGPAAAVTLALAAATAVVVRRG